jgi:anaerobic magnesium-protoporphyrin IX monomethyl ester cyclase
MRDTIVSLAAAGIAAELMCITDFPTETRAEALATLRFIERSRDSVALFICGEFALTRGSAVAARPRDFGVREIWRVAGDELGTGLFYEERRVKHPAQRAAVDDALCALASGWRLRRYPWAGALSTAHTMLWYARYGPGVFRELAASAPGRFPGATWRTATARFDVARVAERSAAREEEIWSELIYDRREVSAASYRELAEASPVARPSPRRWRFTAGQTPERATRARR